MNAQEILKMIETVSPDDLGHRDDYDELVQGKVHEIECHVHAYINGWEVDHFRPERQSIDAMAYCRLRPSPKDNIDEAFPSKYTREYAPQYTRSRDALKKIRPEGYISGASPEFDSDNLKFNGFCESKSRFYSTMPDYDSLPTEELAELHAIIRAMEYERTQNDR